MNRRALGASIALAPLSVALDAATGAKYFPGFAASVGLLGCIAIVVISKWLGTVLSRPEDLYPDEIPSDVQEDLRG